MKRLKMMDLINISVLKEHEQVDQNHLLAIKNSIKNTNLFKEPIIVDKQNLIVLDGHHRLRSCKMLGLSKIPCILVDYLHDSRIRVTTRRKEYKITKEIVVNMARKCEVFPNKTTKHHVPYRIKNLNMPLSSLK